MPDDQRNTPIDDAARDNPYASPMSETVHPAKAHADTADDVPPRMVHLLLWLACSAVALVHVRAAFLEPWLTSPVGYFGFIVVTVLASLVNGIAMASALLFMRRRVLGFAFPRQPGEYWLVATGVVAWLTIVVMEVYSHVRLPAFAGDWMRIALSLFFVVLLYFAALNVSTWRVWSTCLTATATMWLAILVGQANALRQTSQGEILEPPGAIGVLAMLVAIVALGTATIAFGIALDRDRRQQLQRGWIHRVGVYWLFAYVLTGILRSAAFFLWASVTYSFAG